MTAAKRTEVAVVEVREISVEDLVLSPVETRKTIDQATLKELSESIVTHGVQEPLLVRPVLGSDAIFEIVSGQRRWLAAKLAGFSVVPCIVREMSSAAAAEARIIANLQREDLPAMEEAIAFSELLTRLGSVEAIAARVQKDQGYVAKRLKLCSITLAGQDALKHRLITVDHALVLARLGAGEQDAALKWCLDRNAGVKMSVDKVIEQRLESLEEDEKGKREEDSYRWRHTWEPQSVQELKDHIASESGVVLSRAPWDLDSAWIFPDAPACNACPQNTKANAPLFGDLEIGEATCTDGGCFKEKTQAFVQIALKEETELTGFDTLRISWKATSTAPRMEKDASGVNLGQVFKAGQWVEAKKKCEDARSAIAVDWSDGNARGYVGREEKLRKPGELLKVCVEPKCKVHIKDYARPKGASSSNRGDRNEKANQEKRELVEAERIAQSKIRLEIVSRALAGVKSVPAAALRRLALEALPRHDDGLRPYEAVMPGVRKILATAKADSVEFAKAVALSSIGTGELTVLRGWRPEETRKDFVAAVGRLGYDASKAWDKLPAGKQAPGKKPAAKKPPKKAAKKPAKKPGGKGAR